MRTYSWTPKGVRANVYKRAERASTIEANAGHFRAWAKRIIKPDEIKSIIVNDTEYPADGVSNSKKIEIDNRLKPFTIKPYIKEHLWLPL